jgi:hypothetical protein
VGIVNQRFAMNVGLPLPPVLAAIAAGLGAMLLGLLPTCLYRYVEPRGRVQWGDDEGRRRAPAIVRAAAWSSFAVGQLAVPALAVPVACGGLVYLQAQLGVVRPVGLVATVVLGVLALAQSVFAASLVPTGIRLLMNDASAAARLPGRARLLAVVSGAILGGCLVFGWSMTSLPGLVHPWLRAALVWTALRPVELFAALCLLQAFVLGQSARAGASRRAATPR